MDATVLARRLEIAEAEAKMKAYQVADAAGVGRSRYYSWKQGTVEPTVIALAKVAVVLGVSVDWLVGRSDDPRCLPYGQILLNEKAINRILSANYRDDIADLIEKAEPIAIGFDVTPETIMPPRPQAEDLVRRATAKWKTLKWKPWRSGGRKSGGASQDRHE